MASYPSAVYPVPTFGTNMSDAKTHTTWRDEITDEVRAVELELGTAPSRGFSTMLLWATAVDPLQSVNATWTSPISSGITIGNGALAANYTQTGKHVTAQFRFVLGSTSSVTASIVLTLPVTSLDFNGSGIGRLVDTSATTRYEGIIDWSGTTTVILRCVNASSTYATLNSITSTVPFTWANTDEVAVTLNYLAA